MNRRCAARLLSGSMALGLLALGGCASLNTLSAEVASFGSWPAQRAPGTFAFDRLPSQSARADAQAQMEEAALPALEAAGFSLAPPGAEPQFLVQIGARLTRFDRSAWDDPLWRRGGFGPWHPATLPPAAWPAWRWPGPYAGLPIYQREVAILIRERASGAPLFEARAFNDSTAPGQRSWFAAMYAAAMSGFPQVQESPTRVSVPLPP